MKIEIYSDVICPWCFIGKRRLDAVLATDVGEGIELVWRPYQLYPNLPRHGIDRGEFLRARYGEHADRTKTPERIRIDAEQAGITFDYGAIGRVPNTLDAHRLLAFSQLHGRQHDLAEVLFRFYFCDGRDVGDVEELCHAAVEVGLDGDDVGRFLDGNDGVDETLASIRGAFDVGVAGVPCYRLGEAFMLPGAQTPDVMVQFIERARSRLGET